jgi:hypothetical protein
MAASRAVLPLVAGLAFGLAGCYTHYPYGNYGYTPVYTTPPATIAPGTVIGPGVESLGAPSSNPGTFQAPYEGAPSSSRDGNFYERDEQSESRKVVPDYHDPNGPGSVGSGTGTFGSENTTPFGPQGGTAPVWPRTIS